MKSYLNAQEINEALYRYRDALVRSHAIPQGGSIWRALVLSSEYLCAVAELHEDELQDDDFLPPSGSMYNSDTKTECGCFECTGGEK